MEDFLDSCVKRYVDLATEIQGAAPKLRVVGTPFLEDTPGNCPAGSPCAPEGSPSVFCPWCNNHFPVAGNNSDPIEALRVVERKKTKLKKAAEEDKESKRVEDAAVSADCRADGGDTSSSPLPHLAAPLVLVGDDGG